MKRGRPLRGQGGSRISKRVLLNLDSYLQSGVEAYMKIRRLGSYSETVRELTEIGLASVKMIDADSLEETKAEVGSLVVITEPSNGKETKEAKPIHDEDKVGKRFKFPEGYSPAAMVKVCPVCGSDEDFFEDTLQWNCNACLWAGTVADYPVGGITWVTVTHKMRRKYARQEAAS